MNKKLILGILIFLGSMGISAEKKSTMAVVPLQSQSNEFKKEELESYTDHLKSKLSNTQLYIFVDDSDELKRKRLKKIAEEQTGLIDAKNSVVKLGQDLQAEYVLVGKIFKVQEEYRISIKVVNINTSQEEVGTGISKDNSRSSIDSAIDSAIEDLDQKANTEHRLTKTGILWRSAIIPGWGQIASGQRQRKIEITLKGGAILGIGGLLLANLVSSDASYKSAKSNFDSATNINLAMSFTGQYTEMLGFGTFAYANGARSSLDSKATNAQAASLLLVGFYLFNLVDAYYFSGGSVSPTTPESKVGFQINSFHENNFGQKNALTTISYQFTF